METFTTKSLTIEVLEDISAHSVYLVRVNGKEQVMGYNMYRFLKDNAKENKPDWVITNLDEYYEEEN